MQHKRLFALLLFLSALALIGVVGVRAAGGYSLNWWSVDGGGGSSSTGGPYSLGGSIGQFK